MKITIIETANHGRRLKTEGVKYFFSAAVSNQIHDIMQYQGVYGADNPDTVRFWANELICENYAWPGQVPICELLPLFIKAIKNAAASYVSGNQRTIEGLVHAFRSWINEGTRRQQIIEKYVERKPQARQTGSKIEQWSDSDIKSTYDNIKMMGLDRPASEFEPKNSRFKSPRLIREVIDQGISDGPGKFTKRVIDEYERRGL